MSPKDFGGGIILPFHFPYCMYELFSGKII